MLLLTSPHFDIVVFGCVPARDRRAGEPVGALQFPPFQRIYDNSTACFPE